MYQYTLFENLFYFETLQSHYNFNYIRMNNRLNTILFCAIVTAIDLHQYTVKKDRFFWIYENVL